MAQLPTAEALGERPTPQPQLSVVSERTGYEAQALAELGQSINKIGETVEKARRGAQLTDALGRATEEMELKAAEYQRDQDFKTSPTRFRADTKSIGETYAKSIDDPVTRDLFARSFGQKALAKQLTIVQAAAKQEGDYNVSQLDSREDIYVRQAAGAGTPLEREAVLNEARGDLAVMRRAGWITDVDATKRERSILNKIDQAVVTRDLSLDPMMAARNLAMDPQYAPNLDPLARERLVDQGFRRAEAEQGRVDREAEKERRRQADDIMLKAFDMTAKGGVVPQEMLQAARTVVSPSEYHSLLKMNDPAERKDNHAAYAELQRLSYDNPKEAERLAFQYHRNGLIKNDTLSATLTRARGIDRQEGPRSPYERERQYLTNVLKPSDLVQDAAASARYARAVREYDDFATTGKPTDADLRAKADDIAKRMSMVDMVEIARKTSLEVRNDPKSQLEDIQKKATRIKADLDAGRMSQPKYNQEAARLNEAKKSAERALQVTNGR